MQSLNINFMLFIINKVCICVSYMIFLFIIFKRVEKDDYIFMASYCIQGGYCIGKDDFIYIYSKDCNRDADV